MPGTGRRRLVPSERPVASGFSIEPAANLMATGAVGVRSARIWYRCAVADELRFRARPERGDQEPVDRVVQPSSDPLADGTGAFDVDGLEPSTAYAYEVVRIGDGTSLGRGRFETAPEGPAPARFSIALTSCNLPFKDDGSVSNRARSMLLAARRAIAADDAKFLLWTGDQMYADLPECRSLYRAEFFRRIAPESRGGLRDCSAAEVRRIMHARYRAFWSVGELQELHAMVPGYPMWDDHELIDNWGSDPAHARAEWRSVGQGARDAFFDYQASRVLPAQARERACFDYSIDYGDIAVRVVDLRSNRTGGRDGRVVAPVQLDALRTFLAERADRSVLLIVLSVPLVHIPRSVAALGARVFDHQEDFADRWSSPGDLHDRDAILQILLDHQLEHPAQKIVLLSGDIHIGCAHSVRWRDYPVAFHQLVSSALTNRESKMMRRVTALAMSFNRRVTTVDRKVADVRLLKAAYGSNPFLGLNLGMLHLRRDADGGRSMQFRLYGEKDGAPVVGYQSGWF